MDQTVDSDVQQDVRAERDVDTAVPDSTVSLQHVVGSGSQVQEALPPEAASHQVVVGEIPLESPGFRPRASLLSELDRADARVSVIHAGTGLHGLGATQLAAACARAKLDADWRLVAWVNGADTSSVLAGLAAVADATGLTDSDSGRGITDTATAVRQWLETDGDRCLLVFDGVADPEMLRPFVPAHGTARVLITGAWHGAAGLGSSIPVDVFSADEASAFLAGQTGVVDEAGATAVAAALGHLPLALSLAAPLIAGHLGYWQYLDRLQATPADIYLTGNDDEPYPLGVARAVLLSLQAVRTADQTGVCTRVMEIMAVLSPAGVRRELLYVAGQAGVLGSGGRRVEAGLVDRVLEWLRDRSLLTFSLDGQTVIPQRLVGRVILNGLARRRRLMAVCEAAAFVLDLYSQTLVGSQDRRVIRGIPQQVTALLDHLATPVTEAAEELAWLLLRLRFVAFYHLLELGDSTPQAIAVGEPLAEDLERLLGPDHPDTLNSANSLAAAYLAAGRITEAIPLFEQTLAVRQRTLGLNHPETLTSQNNLASAYQDAGRIPEAIRLYELNLEVRERLLGPDHPSTLNSRGNLAAAYQDGGQVTEAIPLLERTLADRERVLGPDHPDTQTSRKNLAKAYQDAGRAAEAIPLLERTLADRKPALRPDTQISRRNLTNGHLTAARIADATAPAEQTPAARKSQPPDGAAGQARPAGFSRPPADPAGRVLPAGFRRPPADPARQPLPSSVARSPAKPTDHSTSRTQDPPEDIPYDRDVVEAIMAKDPAGVAMAYDKYAAALYGYCHWMLHDSADAAEALTNTLVIAAAILSDLPDPSRLRPSLFALARDECRRRIRPVSAAREQEADAVGQPAEVVGEPSDVAMQFRAVGQPSRAVGEPSDVAMQFRAVGQPSRAVGEPSDATMQFRAVGQPSRAVGEPSDATMQFRAVGQPSRAVREPSDATMQFGLVNLSADATMPFRVVSLPASGPAHVNGDQGEAALRTLLYSILAGLKPREREVIELSFRHDLHDNDLAIALGVSWSRAHVLASSARTRLEEALRALHIALTRRGACPVLGELLADWDGQLTEETRDLVSWHIGECQTCAHHGWGALRPTAFSRLLPLAPLPQELREQVLSVCTSAAEDAVAYRRRIVRRAESVWLARFSQTIRLLSWDSIRANPGVAIATTAVAVWIIAAVSVTLLIFAGSHAAHAQTVQSTSSRNAHVQAAQRGAGASSTSPGDAAAAATTRTSAAARPSPAVGQPPAYVSPSTQPSPSPQVSGSSSPSPSRSKSPSPEPSTSASPTPSHSTSPSPSSSSSPTA